MKTAQILAKNNGPTDIICFHCQQAVEKFLKAYLTSKKIYFPKIHQLISLARLCLKINPQFKKFETEFKTLDAYYITSRYPEGPTFYPKNEAENALKSATKIIKFIKQLLSSNQ